MYCPEHGTVVHCPECLDTITDEEIEYIASEMSQQDWNDLRFKEVYRKAFIDGCRYFRNNYGA